MWNFLAKLIGVDAVLPDLERDIAADPGCSAELMMRMAVASPELRSTIRANPSCPPELAEWLDQQERDV